MLYLLCECSIFNLLMLCLFLSGKMHLLFTRIAFSIKVSDSLRKERTGLVLLLLSLVIIAVR